MKKTIVNSLIAILIFGVFILAFWINEKGKKENKNIDVALFGDSLFAFFIEQDSVAYDLREISELNVADYSFGGTCAAYLDLDGRLDYTLDALSLASITQAIASDDYRYQINSNININASEYFDDRIKNLAKTDFSEVKYIFVEHMINDYQQAVPARAGSDKYDEYSYEGALRCSVKRLKDAFPNTNIVLVSPTPSWYEADGEWICSDEYDFGGGTIVEYIGVQKEIAEEFDIDVIDLYSLYGETAGLLWNEYTLDGVHPTLPMARVIAEKINDYIENSQ